MSRYGAARCRRLVPEPTLHMWIAEITVKIDGHRSTGHDRAATELVAGLMALRAD